MTLTPASVRLEDPSTNRGRNGHGKRPRLKADSPWAEGFEPMETRGDARSGKPCGKSHIPRGRKCSKPTVNTPNKAAETAAKVALGVGLIAGGAAITRKWGAADDRRLKEAMDGGRKWDAYELKRKGDANDPEVAELAAQRRRKQEQRCGRTDEGKTQAGRSDAFTPCSRQIGERSAFGALYVHPDEKSVFKVPTGSSQISARMAKDAAENEYKHLQLAYSGLVSVPRPINYNTKTGVIQMGYVRGAVPLRDFNKRSSVTARGQVTDNFLREMQRLHTKGIAHRDLHPGNILVTPTNGVVVIDFGIATSTTHARRDWALDDIYDDLGKVTQRASMMNKINFMNEVDIWVNRDNMPFLSRLKTGKATDDELKIGLQRYYTGLRKALAFKIARPTTTLKPDTQL